MNPLTEQQQEIPEREKLLLDMAERLIKKIANAWRGGLLTMESNSENLTSKERIEELSRKIVQTTSPLINTSTQDELQKLFNKAERIVGAFLESKYSIGAVDPDGFVMIVAQAIKAVVAPKSMNELEIRIGFGASPTAQPNARIPSYILAPKRILTALQGAQDTEYGASPTVNLYSAANFVADINQGDSEKTLTAARSNFSFIQQYLNRFSPRSTALRFTYDEDRKFEKKETDPIYSLIDSYANLLQQKAREWDPSSSERKTYDRVRAMGEKYGSSEQSSVRYATAHSVYSGDLIQGPVGNILQRSAARPENLIMIGGEPEKTFWRVRQLVKKTFDLDETPPPTGQRAQLISQAGKMPVYGMYKGDWSIRDITERSFSDFFNGDLNIEMKRDLLAVLFDVAGLPFDQAYAAKDLTCGWTDSIRTQLREAYEEYAAFCKDFLTLYT